MAARLSRNSRAFELEYRARILHAVADVLAAGRTITIANLRAEGLRGHERRIMKTVAALVVAGQIPVNAWNEGRDVRPVIDPAELAARERSAEWVAEHDALMRRIRRRIRRDRGSA